VFSKTNATATLKNCLMKYQQRSLNITFSVSDFILQKRPKYLITEESLTIRTFLTFSYNNKVPGWSPNWHLKKESMRKNANNFVQQNYESLYKSLPWPIKCVGGAAWCVVHQQICHGFFAKSKSGKTCFNQ